MVKLIDKQNIEADPGVPPLPARREQLLRAADARVARGDLIPPVSVSTLTKVSAALIEEAECPVDWLGFAMVAVNNALWLDTVASVKPGKRLILLPQCLRDPDLCRGEYDEYGLVCADCGACPISAIQKQAEELGSTVLVAEATAAVEELIAKGRFEAIIGVSCLEALQKTFQRMVDRALPGLAVPLLRAGCTRTSVDADWVSEILKTVPRQATSSPSFGIGRMRGIHHRVRSWFSREFLGSVIGNGSETERTAVDWLACDGKRWRPFLVAAVAHTVGRQEVDPDMLRRLAVGIECFHKASLIHDDIEDDDHSRYGTPTLHIRKGIPVAINVGDFLIGEGYRLVVDCGLASAASAQMTLVLARAHRALCLGQGREFSLLEGTCPPTVAELLALFELKTAPAFEAALVVGAIAGGADESVCLLLGHFSRVVGTAFQIRDDLADFETGEMLSSQALVSSVLVARLLEGAKGNRFAKLFPYADREACGRIVEGVRRGGIAEWAQGRLESLKLQAQEICENVEHMPLRQLLFRVAGRIVGGRSVT